MRKLTVSAWLHRRLDVAYALDGDAVLVVLVNVGVLELTHFVEQHTKLVGNIGYVIVASLAPNRQLLLYDVSKGDSNSTRCRRLTATSMRSLPTSSMLLITFFSIFTSWASFLLSSVLPKPAL